MKIPKLFILIIFHFFVLLNYSGYAQDSLFVEKVAAIEDSSRLEEVAEYMENVIAGKEQVIAEMKKEAYYWFAEANYRGKVLNNPFFENRQYYQSKNQTSSIYELFEDAIKRQQRGSKLIGQSEEKLIWCKFREANNSTSIDRQKKLYKEIYDEVTISDTSGSPEPSIQRLSILKHTSSLRYWSLMKNESNAIIDINVFKNLGQPPLNFTRDNLQKLVTEIYGKLIEAQLSIIHNNNKTALAVLADSDALLKSANDSDLFRNEKDALYYYQTLITLYKYSIVPDSVSLQALADYGTKLNISSNPFKSIFT